MKRSISVKQILVDIISILPQVLQKHENDENYKALLSFLKAKDYLNNDDLPYPTIKQIETDTNLKSHQIRKQLTTIYNGLFDFPYDHPFNFGNISTYFSVKYNKEHTSFKLKNLKYIPRIGENIHLRFLEAKLGINIFYVDEIQHEFIEMEHVVRVYLKGGTFNSYWYYRKHKALELGEIGFMDEYQLYDFQIKEKLGLNYRY